MPRAEQNRQKDEVEAGVAVGPAGLMVWVRSNLQVIAIMASLLIHAGVMYQIVLTLDKRVQHLEDTYVPRKEIEANQEATRALFQDFKDMLRQQAEDTREIRRYITAMPQK